MTVKTSKPPRPKKCKVCGNPFVPTLPLQKVCSVTCARDVAIKTREKAEAKQYREAKAKSKPRREYVKEAQAEFNKFIRLRDHRAACISCGRHHDGQWHAGHFLTVGAHPELRFEERNCHKQCAPCNNHLSGNVALYRVGLIERYGQGIVDWLMGPHEPKHYTIEELIEIKKTYRAKARELEKEIGGG